MENIEKKEHLRSILIHLQSEFGGEFGYDEEGKLNSLQIDEDNCAAIKLSEINGKLTPELTIVGGYIVDFIKYI
jgi:hypothetical protein